MTPLTKGPIVDKAIDSMLAANVIQLSRSPWLQKILYRF